MADRYVWNGATGSGTGATWANAHTTLTAAITASTAGDRFFVAHDHAQTVASGLSLTFKGTASAPDTVLCVDRAGSVPPVSADLRTTATVSTTLASTLGLHGHFYCYGIKFQAGSAANVANLNILNSPAASVIELVNCELNVNNTAASVLQIGVTGAVQQQVTLRGTKMLFGAVGQGVALSTGRFVWKNTASALGGAIFPTVLFANLGVLKGTFALIEGVDLSALGSGKSIVGGDVAAAHTVVLKDCKLGASVAISSAVTSPGGPRTLVVRRSHTTDFSG